MFAVPGWSVPASALKTQVAESLNPAPSKSTAATTHNGESGPAAKSSKKRKRSNGTSKQKDMSGNNLADLWESVIEGKKKSKKQDKKRQKVEKNTEVSMIENSEGADGPEQKGDKQTPEAEKGLGAGKPEINGDGAVEERLKTTNVVAKRMIAHGLGIKLDKVERKVEIVAEEVGNGGEGTSPKEKVHKKSKKEEKQEKKSAFEQPAGDGSTPTTTEAKAAKPMPTPKIVPQLTPLQASMRQKLISARFRHLNETLYTKPSAHSLSLFQDNPEMFSEYHEGFRRQVEVWPENPVDSYISTIKTRGKVRGPPRGKPDKKAEQSLPADAPLPRTEGTSTIADLGCGDAALSTALQPMAKKLHLKIHSFDLQSPSSLVTKADIANLPLADGSVDIAIFCLALMGTNWIDFIEESFRILRWKGELWVAEIKSRFGRVGGRGKRVEHSVGNRKKHGRENKKEKKKAEDESNDLVAAVEVDGVEDKGAETDVSAFVEVLRKRGFVLKDGEGGIDLRNKMFVKMCFVKGATPVKGKCVPVPKGMEKFGGGETWKKKPKGKFIDGEEDHVSSEAGVLKPCVYKLR
ncbi:putative methyltransferase domain containing protein [Hyaloscypha variabilis]